jgi:NADH-quinone oxidoreductase subunit C
VQLDDYQKLLLTEIPGLAIDQDLNAQPPALLIPKDHLLEVMKVLYSHKELFFDVLSCLTGIDNGPDNPMEMVYNLFSIPFERSLMIKVKLDRQSPVVDSVSEIWKTADWHEREAFDLLGIQFNGHPDLRRILMPGDWEGYPLRKDYEEQEFYHGIKVKY